MSRQKEVIYDIVASTVSHPEADWIYQKARRKMPHISLGTVYRNLRALTDEGRILEINTTKGPARYDANVSRHSHLRCVDCDLLMDVPESDIRLMPRPRQPREFKVLEYRVEFLGVCPDCQDKRTTRT